MNNNVNNNAWIAIHLLPQNEVKDRQKVIICVIVC